MWLQLGWHAFARLTHVLQEQYNGKRAVALVVVASTATGAICGRHSGSYVKLLHDTGKYMVGPGL